jgi:hypothetical protein
MTTRRCYEAVMDAFSDEVREFIYRDIFNVALVIHDCVRCHDLAVSSIRSPVSTCRAVSLTVLSPKEGVGGEGNAPSAAAILEARAWLEKSSIDPDITEILFGEEGFYKVLQNTSVHAVYIFVPAHLQQQYVLEALQAGKHVLLKDIVSTPSKDYSHQLDCAKAVNKFIQFSTMFVHHYRVQTFLNCVCARQTFGNIDSIDSILTVNSQDLALLNVSLPLSPGQGCIRRLARFSVLVATLMLQANHKPVRATVTDFIVDEASGEPLSANCEVEFSDNILLKCYVVYSDAPTRQVLTVRSSTKRYATMTDFVFPHPDGLATYRVYDKMKNEHTGKYDIVRGECLDVPTGPPQNVAMWRNFHALCNTVDQYGWGTNAPSPEDPGLHEALLMTEAAIQTKRILIALDESFEQKGASVQL